MKPLNLSQKYFSSKKSLNLLVNVLIYYLYYKLWKFVLNYRSERKKDQRGMIEMDRFVTTLQGVEDEVIERESVDSAATMRKPITNDQ